MFVPDNGTVYKIYEQKNAIQKDASLGHYFISDEKFKELKGFEVMSNDIIVSCAGTIGETYIMPNDIRPGIINQALMIIRLHNLDITPFYLLYFDFILKKEAGKDGKGTAIKNIPPFEILKNYLIPLPPIAEQCRIIKEVAVWQSFIDSINGGCDDILKLCNTAKSKILDLAISGKLVPQDSNDEPAIELLKRINPNFVPCDKSHYENLPKGWTICKISDLCKIENGFAFSSDDYKTSGIPLIRISNITNNTIDLSDCVYIENIEINDKYIISKGDLLIAMSGATTGKMGVYMNNNISYLNQRVCNVKIIDNSILLHSYRNYFLQSKVSEILKLAYGGAQPNISTTMIGNFEILLPPYNEQERIVSTIESIFTQIDSIIAEL